MFLRPWRQHLVLVLLCMCLSPLPVRAADDFDHSLAQAIRLYESLEYEAALSQLAHTRTLAQDARQDVQVSLHEGIILANLGRWERARSAFRAALLKEPEATLPLMVPPKVEKELESVRTRVRRELASARAREPKPEVITSLPAPAPVASSDRPEQAAAPLLTPAAPAPAPELAPQVEVRSARAPVLPWVLLGTGVVAGGMGGYFGWTSRGQIASAREASRQSDAAVRLDEARGSARVANILLGSAGLAAAGALVSWLLHDGDADSSSLGDSP
ncbi:hypothetical protein [Melittangium boletus]|uniref:Tetratricopeptide repeat protein n=1 Tax=Melittangium boletus DSM 14713 TaxID=1294270 RepID=A0A250I748_9BACT|nr:hypothetical protein [Melittangium boletus]ATB27013.1 hypothetical protein MEBOL_000448 [Melittangium boletus DSM 14713]